MRKSIVAIILSMTVIFLTSCDMPPPETKSIRSLKLTSIESVEQKGTFILGVGTYQAKSTIETKYYLYVLKDEGYMLTEIDSNRLEIVETDEIEPCIKGQFQANGKLNSTWDCTAYVPVGTVFEEYSAILP